MIIKKEFELLQRKGFKINLENNKIFLKVNPLCRVKGGIVSNLLFT